MFPEQALCVPLTIYHREGKMFKCIPSRLIVFLIVLPLLVLTSCRSCCNGGSTDVNCDRRGSHSYFVAAFNADTPGSPPAPTAPLHYGPPGAGLEHMGSAGTVEILNAAAFGSNALKITRGAPDPTEVTCKVGEIDSATNTLGVYFIEFRAQGEVIPDPFIAGTDISVRSSAGNAALILRLYEGVYHLKEGDSYVMLSGDYNPGLVHKIHIELNFDIRRYAICIDEEVVAANKAFLSEQFEDLSALKYFMAPTITEAFENIYIVDDIRVTK